MSCPTICLESSQTELNSKIFPTYLTINKHGHKSHHCPLGKKEQIKAEIKRMPSGNNSGIILQLGSCHLRI